MFPMRDSGEAQLDALFRAYRDACPDPQPSVNFMPDLWKRIDSRQSFTFSFKRMASALVTTAVALSIALSAYMSIHSSNPNYNSESYIEALAEASTLDTPDIVGPATLDIGDSSR